ncbi:hypothetical protein [Bacillus sp. 1P02SD]|uniref:hypothetical protein n=1 Tax=Bacillus sp. 1P02SD TaxID=3132264 RepID=UPI00399F2F12
MKNMFLQCVEGSVCKTYEYLKNLDYKTEEQMKMEEEYDNRFFKENPNYKIYHEDPWIENIMNTYRDYFVVVLTNRKERSVAETDLLNKLNRFLPMDFRGADMESTEEKLKIIFNEKGFGFKDGKVTPHYGPFIWKTSNIRRYSVDLPDSTQEVQVCFLDDFLMLSWLHFATFGKVYAGGWAEKDALYCILPNYRDKLETDVFRVSFLKHEAQHFSDYIQFPKLKGKDLEYRAKLVELIYYSSFEVFEKFMVQAVNNANPHNYSAFIIIERFSKHFFNKNAERQVEKWTSINYEDIQDFAKVLFKEHTALLISKDAQIVEGVI